MCTPCSVLLLLTLPCGIGARWAHTTSLRRSGIWGRGGMESNGGRVKETYGIEWRQGGTHGIKGSVKETRGTRGIKGRVKETMWSNGVEGAHMGS